MNYTGTDFYCDVAIPKKVDLQIEYESDNVLAYHHTKPFWPVHIIVTSKKHIDSFLTLDESNKEIFTEIVKVIQQLAEKVKSENGSCRILTNLGEYQDSKHLHFHVSFGKPLR